MVLYGYFHIVLKYFKWTQHISIWLSIVNHIIFVFMFIYITLCYMNISELIWPHDQTVIYHDWSHVYNKYINYLLSILLPTFILIFGTFAPPLWIRVMMYGKPYGIKTWAPRTFKGWYTSADPYTNIYATSCGSMRQELKWSPIP